jgi:hypothetical protein
MPCQDWIIDTVAIESFREAAARQDLVSNSCLLITPVQLDIDDRVAHAEYLRRSLKRRGPGGVFSACRV